VISVRLVTLGTLNASIIHPREIFRPLITESACSFVVGHNHPGGVAKPSPEDIVATRHLRDADELLGVELLDHVIVAGPQVGTDDPVYVSLKEAGYF
jgi:DNA repair protein RadC